jgi:transcriptional regulator
MLMTGTEKQTEWREEVMTGADQETYHAILDALKHVNVERISIKCIGNGAYRVRFSSSLKAPVECSIVAGTESPEILKVILAKASEYSSKQGTP